MADLEASLYRRVAKIQKDGGRWWQKFSLTAKLQTCNITLPCLPALKRKTHWEMKDKDIVTFSLLLE